MVVLSRIALDAWSGDVVIDTTTPTTIRAILTHEHPDLDAALCVWLLRRYGGAKYPGIENVPVMFTPAGHLPDGLDPDTLERERGILAVDTGGGRLDTHGRGRAVSAQRGAASASLLVAEDLGVARRPELTKLLEFVRLQEVRGRSIESRRPMDHLVCLPSLFRGLNLCHASEPQRVIDIAMELFDAARATELDWLQAKKDYASARVLRLDNKARLVGVESDSTSAAKVARLHRADLVVHRNSLGHTGVTVHTRGRLGDLDLSPLAAMLRLAEAAARGEPVDVAELYHVGMVGGWYLHDSGKIVAKGSPKNPTVEPSCLSVQEILDLAAAVIEPSRGMPPAVCGRVRSPGTGCEGCAFAEADMEACRVVRAVEPR